MFAFPVRIGFAVLLALSSLAYADEQAGFPRVYFEYGIFDRLCHSVATYPISDEMRLELEQALPAIQAEWDQEEPALLGGAVALFGKRFARQELVATMTLCAGVPPMSSPLMINMRPYLNIPTGYAPRPRFYLVGTIFHELLHRYLVDNFQDALFLGGGSPLIQKYRGNCGLDDCGTVLAHMHLMAIVRTVYLKLDRADQLRHIVELDSGIANPGYKRSWEIVNEEGAEAFVREIKAIGTLQ